MRQRHRDTGDPIRLAIIHQQITAPAQDTDILFLANHGVAFNLRGKMGLRPQFTTHLAF
jgi:hypothetical protein